MSKKSDMGCQSIEFDHPMFTLKSFSRSKDTLREGPREYHLFWHTWAHDESEKGDIIAYSDSSCCKTPQTQNFSSSRLILYVLRCGGLQESKEFSVKKSKFSCKKSMDGSEKLNILIEFEPKDH